MANVLKHRFVSAKVDGGDPSQIQPSNWNDGHAFSGGNAGEILTRDPTDALYGAMWAPYKTNLLLGSTFGSGEWNLAALAGKSTHIRWIGAGADATVSGIAGGVAGQTLTIRNESAAQFLTLNAMDGTIAAASRFFNFVTIGPMRVGVGGAVTYVHDGDKWVMVAHHQGRWFTRVPNPGNFLSVGGGTWAVEAADVVTDAYWISGRTMTMAVGLIGTAVTGPAPSLAVLLPAGHQGALGRLFINPIVLNEVGGAGLLTGFAQVDSTSGVGATGIGLFRFGGNFPTSALNAFFQIAFEIQ